MKLLCLFDFLLQIVEEIGVEELADGDIHTVADLFERYDAGVHALLIEHAVNGGRRNPGGVRQRVDRDLLLLAERKNPLCNRFFRVQSPHHLSVM